MTNDQAAKLQVGQKVRITGGIFQGHVGIVTTDVSNRCQTPVVPIHLSAFPETHDWPTSACQMEIER